MNVGFENASDAGSKRRVSETDRSQVRRQSRTPLGDCHSSLISIKSDDHRGVTVQKAKAGPMCNLLFPL